MFRYLFIIFVFFFIYSCASQPDSEQQRHRAVVNVTLLNPIRINGKMVFVTGGKYKPFYESGSDSVHVAPFLIDERPVTNAEFLEFVTANPQWRKSNIKRIYSDTTYLCDWPADLRLPAKALPNAPVCYVSWFAAKSFAQAAEKRMPTLDEWEYVAMADTTTANARSKPGYSDAIIDLYLQKNRQYQAVKQSPPNYWGVYNLFDLIWEWTDDFNSVLTTGDARAGQYDNKGLFCAAGATSATDVLNYAAFMRFGLRASLKAHYTVANLGFRCAKDTTINP